MTFIEFREAVLAKAFRRTRRIRKTSQKAAGGQRFLKLHPPTPKGKIGLYGARNGGKRHSKAEGA